MSADRAPEEFPYSSGGAVFAALHSGLVAVITQDWYRSIPDAVIAESILNRLIAGAEIITLEGPNMRLEANQ